MSNYTIQQLQDYAYGIAVEHGIDPSFFNAQIGAESNWNIFAKNPNSSASGIAQFVTSTAKQFNIDPNNPLQALDAAAKYDASLLQKYGSYVSTAFHYGTTAGGITNSALQKLQDIASSLDQFGNTMNLSSLGSNNPVTAGMSIGKTTTKWTDAIAQFFSLNTAERGVAIIAGLGLLIVSLSVILSQSQTVRNIIK